MPIKFACTACKNVMTVDDKFAGKTGKCNKCGAAVKVPMPAAAGAQASAPAGPQRSPAAAPATNTTQTAAEAKAAQIAALNAAPPPSAGKLAAAGPLGHVLDELTESDYSRQSPYQNVYAPPKPKATNNEALKRAASTAGGGDEVKKPKVGADGKTSLTTTLIIFAVFDILEAVTLYGLVIALAVLGIAFMEPIQDKVPFLAIGLSVLIVIFGLLATLMMASGLGILTKQVWGYCVAVFVYSFTLGFRLVVVLASITEPSRLLGPGFLAFCMLSCTAYFFQKECKDSFGVKSSKLALIVGGIGVSIPLLIGGVLFLLGSFANDTPPPLSP